MRLTLEDFSRPPVLLWLALRVITLAVILIAGLYATGSLPGTAILANKYDVRYYARIVERGYQSGDVTANFHPLYPWLSSIVAKVAQDPFVSLLAVSSAAGLLLAIAFYRLARLDCEPKKAWLATAALLCWPASAALFVPYTEALFLLLAVLCLGAARRQRFWLAGLWGALACLTRQHGLFLVLPLGWELLEASKQDWRRWLLHWPSVILIPLGYAAWTIYRTLIINDAPADFSNLRAFINSVMLSPASRALLPHHEFMMPWTAVLKALGIVWAGTHWSAVGSLVLGFAFLLMFVLAWRHLRTSYRVYSLAVVLAAFSFHTGPLDPYMALPRHLLPAFPVFIGASLAYDVEHPRFMLSIFVLCQMLVLCCFVWQTWVL